jgi:hypothetical protein
MILRANDFIPIRFGRMNPVLRAIAWLVTTGIVFAILSTILRVVAVRLVTLPAAMRPPGAP